MTPPTDASGGSEFVAVVGFGDIGSAAARALQGRMAHVMVHDVDPIRQASAKLEGFRVGSLAECIATSNLILGCSGSRSLTSDVLHYAADGAVFASGSSKQVEIDVDFFLQEGVEIESNGELTVCYHDGRQRFLLNEGKPINFLDGSAIGSTLDLVYTELYACTEAIAQRRVHSSGLLSLSPDEQREIAKMWLGIYTEPNRSSPIGSVTKTAAGGAVT